MTDSSNKSDKLSFSSAFYASSDVEAALRKLTESRKETYERFIKAGFTKGDLLGIIDYALTENKSLSFKASSSSSAVSANKMQTLREIRNQKFQKEKEARHALVVEILKQAGKPVKLQYIFVKLQGRLGGVLTNQTMYLWVKELAAQKVITRVRHGYYRLAKPTTARIAATQPATEQPKEQELIGDDIGKWVKQVFAETNGKVRYTSLCEDWERSHPKQKDITAVYNKILDVVTELCEAGFIRRAGTAVYRRVIEKSTKKAAVSAPQGSKTHKKVNAINYNQRVLQILKETSNGMSHVSVWKRFQDTSRQANINKFNDTMRELLNSKRITYKEGMYLPNTH